MNLNRSLLLALPLVAALGLPAAAAPATTLLPPLRSSLAAPARVACDSAGRVWVTDSKLNALVAFDGFGRKVLQKPGWSAPLGLAVDRAGVVYLAEEGRGRVTVLNPELVPTGALGQGDGEFQLPNHIALREDAGATTVYVSDSARHQVRVYRDNALVGTVGAAGSGPGQFWFPTGLAVSPGGELFVVDQGNDRVLVFGPDDAYRRAFTLRDPATGERRGMAQGIAVDAGGRVWVADAFQDDLRAFSPNGEALAHTSGPWQLRTPMGLAIDGAGRLFVADPGNGRVDVFGLDCFLWLMAAPSAQTVAAGATVTFTTTYNCAGPLSCQWFPGTNALQDGGRISGSTGLTLTLAGVTAAEAGTYHAVLTVQGGTVLTTPPAQLSVASVPVITRHPVGQTVAEGGTIALDVQATGTELTYQWLYNGSAVTGGTASTLAIPNAKAAMSGSYSVRVSTPAGTISSGTATVTVVARPEIVTHPASQTVAEYGTAVFQGLANGRAPIYYQWYYNGTPVAGSGNTLTRSNVSPAQAGAYQLVVNNAGGAVTSQVAVLTVLRDTVAPVLLNADGGRANSNTIVLTFSEPLAPNPARTLANYTLQPASSLAISGVTFTNGSNVVLFLNGLRAPGSNYTLRVQNLQDLAYQPNTLSPNPTVVPVRMTLTLAGVTNTSWKYLQPTNNLMDGQQWKLSTFNDATWSNGFGIFYGNRSNSVYQPNPNPNVVLPFSLSTSDPVNTRVYTVLNVFTNGGNVIRTTTYYFRTAFNFPAETNGVSLLLHSILDDGAVFWLNGVELRRDRMASGTPVFATLASSSGSQSWSPAITAAGTVLPLAGLKKGVNQLAVEVHQRSTTDTDMTFGLWLEGVIPAFAPGMLGAAPLSIDLPASGHVAMASTPEGLVLVWADTGFLLETAPDLAGPWEVLSTTSPHLVPPDQCGAAPARFYRLRPVQVEAIPGIDPAADCPARTADEQRLPDPGL